MVTVDDMRSSITFQLDNGKTIAVNATVSYKKHLAESYRTNGEYRPKTAPINTVCNLTQTEPAGTMPLTSKG